MSHQTKQEQFRQAKLSLDYQYSANNDLLETGKDIERPDGTWFFTFSSKDNSEVKFYIYHDYRGDKLVEKIFTVIPGGKK